MIVLLVLILLALLFPGFMRMVVLGLVIIVAWAWMTTAKADDAPEEQIVGAKLPVYDVNTRCEWTFGNNRMAFNSCIDNEQSAYDLLKYYWPTLTANVQNQVIDLMAKIASENNPYLYQNGYELSQVLTSQELIRREMTAPKRRFSPSP